jgi:hypothetical protein
MSATLRFPKSRFKIPASYQTTSKPAKVHPVPVTPGYFAELTWRHDNHLPQPTTCEGRADLATWLARRPELDDALDLTRPIHVRLAEQERIASILRKVRKGLGWPRGGLILMSPSGWPVGFRSRAGLGKVARAEVGWFAEITGMDLVWNREAGGWQAVLGLPGSAIPEIETFAEIVASVGR